jgi:hypothetical protein
LAGRLKALLPLMMLQEFFFIPIDYHSNNSIFVNDDMLKGKFVFLPLVK